MLFTSDHGVPFPRAKCSLFDPGLEVPLIVRWPNGPWAARSVFDAMISNIDFLPTVLELLGLAVPANVQGRSFAPLLRGKPSFSPGSTIDLKLLGSGHLPGLHPLCFIACGSSSAASDDGDRLR